MDALLQDVRFALRGLYKQPGFALVAILTLALGIGANSAIFTVVNAVLLEPLPFAHADRLVRVTADLPGLGTADIGMSAPELFDYRDRAGIFEDIAGLYPVDANLTEVDQPERVEVLLASPTYFSVLGARPALGRVFGPQDDHPGIAEVAVISDALWRRRFGSAPDVLGRTLRIDDDSYTIVGVMPPGFRHPGRSLQGEVELWAPAGFRAEPFPAPGRRGYFLTGSIARLKPGLTVAQAQRHMDAFAARVRAEFPSDYPERASWTPRIVALQDDLVGNVRPALVLLLAAVAIVLLIACANVAGLLLARAAARQRELAVRRALGSGRLRLVRLLLTESLVLALAGGALGLLIATWSLEALMRLVPRTLPRIAEIGMDWRVLAFTFAASLVTGALFGLAPALQFSNPDVLGALKDGRSAAGRSRRMLRSSLVVLEFALAMVLLVGASLLVRSFWALQHVDAGFDGHSVLSARVWLPRPNDSTRGKYLSHPPRVALFDDIIRRARELPGVESAAIVQNLPLDGQRGGFSITIDGRDSHATGQMPSVQTNFASPEYFPLMRIPVLEGRALGPEDAAQGTPVIVINQDMARRFFAGTDPIGQRVHFGGAGAQAPWMTIVGVVGNVLAERLDAGPRPMLYRPMAQQTNLSLAVVVRTAGDPSRLATELPRIVREANPDLPTFAVRTMDDVLAEATASRRFSMQLLGGFALLALVLAAVGIYGMMAYLVSQRTRELGIRIALGARQSAVLRMIVSHALALAAGGVLVGVLAALMMSRLFGGLLFRVSPTDPVTFVAIASALIGTAVLAAAMPARRAAKVDPMVALRGD